MKTHNDFYHYTECGLDDVWLMNGFETHDTGYGKGISIHNVDGLHKTIGLSIANRKAKPNGKEIRFLRHEMDLSQVALAGLLMTTDQTVARWEKEKNNAKIPGPAQALLSILYREATDGDGDIKEHLERLARLDAMAHEDLCLSLSENEEWDRCNNAA